MGKGLDPMQAEERNRIIIFDTTLRDGEQSPGVALSAEEKVEIAEQLARLGVDVIEAGFPISSPGDFEAVRAIAHRVKGPIIAGLSRANPRDVERAGEALEPAARRRIHTFIATSEIHMKYKLRMEPDAVVAAAVEAVRRARRYTDDVEFSAEDATRSNLDFLARILSAAVEAGATTINVPDTVGYTTPQEFHRLITFLRQRVVGADRVKFSVHCHNDLGLAVANSLAAIEAGAVQVETTINGIGERAGNTSMEEVVMAMRTRRDYYHGWETGIATEHFYRTSRLVSSLTGMAVQANKAVVGANAFAHQAGIHQDGVLKEPLTYEIMRPQDVGVPKSLLVMGKLSGRHAFRERLKELGYEMTDEELQKAFARFKELADRKKDGVTDRDLEAIVEAERQLPAEIFGLDSFHVTSGTSTPPTATICLQVQGQRYQEAAWGTGPVDALYRAIDRITSLQCRLEDYSLKAVTSGQDALGEVTVRVAARRGEEGEVAMLGRGVSTDIIEASVKAYLAAVNKLCLTTGSHPMPPEALRVKEAVSQ